MDFPNRFFFEGWRLPNTGLTRVTDIPCSACGKSLIEIPFSAGITLSCDNYGCALFRERQGIRKANRVCRVCHTELNGNWSPFRKRQKSNICKTCDSIQRKSRQNYPVELEQKRERYAYARSLGFPCKVAARIDYKSKEAIREIAEVQGLLN